VLNPPDDVRLAGPWASEDGNDAVAGLDWSEQPFQQVILPQAALSTNSGVDAASICGPLSRYSDREDHGRNVSCEKSLIKALGNIRPDQPVSIGLPTGWPCVI
jgi:hypothetical protein